MVAGILFSYKIGVGIEVGILPMLGSLYESNAAIYFLWYINESITFPSVTSAPATREQGQLSGLSVSNL